MRYDGTCGGRRSAIILGRELAIPACLVRSLVPATSGKVALLTVQGILTMEDASTGTTPDGSPAKIWSEHSESPFDSTPQHYYVFVSDREIPTLEWEYCCLAGDDSISTDYDDVGAVYIGELTVIQITRCLEEFRRLCSDVCYRVRFIPHTFLSVDKEKSLDELFENYKILEPNQKKVLDIALHTANSVRKRDGCGSKNITAKKSKQKMPKQPTKGEKPKEPPKPRRNSSKREKDLDKGIVDFLFHKLTKQKKTREAVAAELKLGEGALSGKYAKSLIEEMKSMLHGAPKAKDFARATGDIELVNFHKALYQFIWNALKEAKKSIVVKTLQTPEKKEKDTIDNEKL